MHAGERRRWLQTIVLAVLLALSVTHLETVLPSSGPSVALADEKDDQKDNHDKGSDGDEDHVARGQVIDINTLADPPELTLAGVDGEMKVKVLKTDEIALNGVKLCYYIKLDGEKIHEYLFEATKIEVETKKKC
jgi:hypothetical protein